MHIEFQKVTPNSSNERRLGTSSQVTARYPGTNPGILFFLFFFPGVLPAPAMFCSSCGCALEEGDNFCSKCGAGKCIQAFHTVIYRLKQLHLYSGDSLVCCRARRCDPWGRQCAQLLLSGDQIFTPGRQPGPQDR